MTKSFEPAAYDEEYTNDHMKSFTEGHFVHHRVYRGVTAKGQKTGSLPTTAISELVLNSALRYALCPDPVCPCPPLIDTAASACVQCGGPCALLYTTIYNAGILRSFLNTQTSWIFGCGHACHMGCAARLIQTAKDQAVDPKQFRADTRIL